MKNKIKLSILLIPAFIFVSCRNFFSDDLIERKDSEITVLQGYYSLENNYSARTAIPFPELSTYTFEITAESQETPPADSVDGVIDSAHNSYSIELTDGNWKLAINGYKDAAKTEKALCAENNITIDNCGITAGSLNFVLQMFQTPLAVTADVLLPIEVTSEISRVEALWKESGIEKKQTIIQNSSSTSGNFTMINDSETSLTAVNGNYDVLFRFYKKIGAAEVIAYSLVEKINLYDYLTTNKWIGNSSSPFYKNGKLVISDNIIKTYDKDIFYVSSSGSDATNSGGFFDPFASVQSAVEIIQAIADPEVEQYTIYLKDNITLAPDYTDWPMQADGVTPEDSYITINPSSSLKIKITSYGEPAAPYSINANRSAANTGRVMYVGEKAEVTIENLCISGGFSQNDGAGVYINKGKLILNNGAEVTDSFVAAADLYAAGVYNLEGTLTMNNGSSIHDNGDDVNAANGGGVYCKTGSLYMNPGSKIYGNTGKSGAGIKLLSSKGVIDGAEIYGNKVSVATDNGGGIWYSPNVLNPEALEIKDTQIYMNEAPSGAGLYSKGDVKISGNTEFNVNHASGMGGGILNISGIVDISDSVKFNSNTAAKGSAVYLAETQGVELHLKDKVAFENSIATQTIYGKYNTTKAAYPVIKLGTFAGNAADQTLNLVFDSYNTGSIVITPDTGVDISAMIANINVLKEDLTASSYFVDTDGTLESNIVIGPNGGNASSAYEDVVPFGDGTGITTAGNYSISTKEELTAFATWATTTTSTNYTFVLYDNIDLEGVPFSPIGGTKAFGGTFDGNGNKIKNLKINSASGNAALFGKVGANATVKNLYVHGEVKGGGANVAGIVSEISVNTGRIDNCVADVTVSTSSGSSVGGICGSAKGMIINCVNIGSVTGSASGINVGGICGSAELSVYNSANFGNISGFSSVGGIVGTLTSYQTIGNCYNYGVISSTQTNNRGAIEGNGTLSCTFEDLYYHANSSVTKAIAGTNYPSVGETFTNPDLLRSTLNTNLGKTEYSSLSLAKWNYDYKIDGVKYPVCTTFACQKKLV